MSNSPIDFKKLVIETVPHWTVQLHEDQSYLGRIVIALTRPAEVDFLDLSEDEHAAYFKVARRCKQALCELFAPDMFNHASLRNEWRQQHVHLVPRYQTPRNFGEREFVDARWGRNWAPNEKLLLPEAELLQIHATIQARLLLTP